MGVNVPIIFLLVVCAFLPSCQKQCRAWSYDEIHGSCKSFDSQKMTLKTANRIRGIELKIVSTQSGQRCIVDVFSLPILSDETTISCCVEKNSRTFDAKRLEGGQRLILSKEAEDYLITNLLNDKTITLTLGRYREEIIPNGFTKVYRTYTHNSSK